MSSDAAAKSVPRYVPVVQLLNETAEVEQSIDATVLTYRGVTCHVYGVLHGLTGGTNRQYRDLVEKAIENAPGELVFGETKFGKLYRGIQVEMDDWTEIPLRDAFRMQFKAALTPMRMFMVAGGMRRERRTAMDRFGRNAGERDIVQLAIGRRQDEIARQRTVVEKLDAVQVEHAALSTELKGLEQQGVAGAKLADSLKLQADVIDTVPCRDDPMHASCPLLAQARSAKAKLGEQVVSVKALRESYRKKQEHMQSMQSAMSERATARAALSALEAHLVRDQQLLQRLTAMAAKKPLLEAAREGLARAERDLTELSEEDASRIERHKRDIADVQFQLEAVRRELATLATEDVTGMLATLDRQIAASREAVAAFSGRIEALIRQESNLVAERERLDVQLAGMPSLEAKAQALSDQIAQWKLLAKGLGNDGVIALSIDDAGPAITQIVNDLLLACYEPRFTIAIQTQTALASGEVREGFSINVIDADTDTTKEFGVMSGGQKVWINECLTRGIALYRAQDAEQPFQTLFTDEADGPLDPERKRAFMKMKREVLRVGGYEREYFISQTPDLVDDADGVIDVVALALQ